jgi:hypothetical protein
MKNYIELDTANSVEKFQGANIALNFNRMSKNRKDVIKVKWIKPI